MICKLSDIVNTANTGADAIKKAPILNEPTNLRCLRIGDVSQKRDFSMWGYTKTSKMDYERYKLHKGDSIIARTGNTIGVCTYIEDDIESVYNNGLIRLTAKTELARERFLFYLIRSTACQDYIQSIAYGTSTQPNMKIKDFLNFDIIVPTLEIQDKIIAIVDKIEKKIQVNTEINNNLEQQAMALFKSWFIDFEPFNRQVPKTWINGVLGDFVEIKRGGSPRPIQDFLSDSGFHWLKISDATGISSPFINEIKEYIIEAGLKKTVYLKSGSLVLSNSATPGLPKILDIDTCIHDGWLYFPSSKFSNEYLYLYFKHIRDNLIALGNGSVFTNLKTDILKNYPTYLPTEDVLKKFDGLVQPIFSMILSKTREIKRLAEIRDTLLPKLMSGELDVSDIEL